MCEEGYLKFNPAADLSTAKTETKLPVVFSEIDTGKLIDSVSDIRDRAALETLYALGIRVAELVGIQVKDIDFINRRVRVFGKGRKERVVPMNNSAKNILLEYISTLERNDLDDYVFPSPVNQGKPVTTRAMYDVVIKYAKLNGMDGMSPHKFRHAFATHMHARGMDIRDLQELLGHADIGTTTIYTKVVNENLARNYHSAHPRG
jgi:site-specific recombinase XerD